MTNKYGVFDSGKAHMKGAVGAAEATGASTFLVLMNVLASILRSKGYLPWDADQDAAIASAFAVVVAGASAYAMRFQLNKRKHT